METILKVLIIDDDQDDILLAKEYLQHSNRAKFQVQMAGSLAEGFELIKTNTFDCILLDLGLPETSSLDTITHFMRYRVETPVVILSNNVDEKIGTQAMRLGAEDYLVKRNLWKENLCNTVLHSIERFRLRKTIDEKNAQLIKNAQHSKQILDNAISGLVIINKENNILFVNPAAEKLFGRTENEMLSFPFGYAIESNAPTEITLHAKDNTIKTVELKTSAIEWLGEPCLLVSMNDITERKQAELLLLEKNREIEAQNEKLNQVNAELILSKEKAEESDRLKTVFLSNMSHEIRTPMNGILGFLEMLKDVELTGEQKERYFEVIEQSGQRMLDLLNDLIDISRIEAGEVKACFSDCNINERIDYVRNFFKPAVERKGMQFLIKKSLPYHESVLKTDAMKVQTILTSLMKNAIKFSHQGLIELGYEKKEEFVEFYVRDTGIGISSDQHETIFERFRQVNESYSREYDGAGLGLAIAKSYVEILGGKLWVESEVGKGSTFFFTIPATS
ncbi:MAG: ATP-binding protein [Prolixibacteraceae bacterium]